MKTRSLAYLIILYFTCISCNAGNKPFCAKTDSTSAQQHIQEDYAKLVQQIALKRDSLHKCYNASGNLLKDSIIKVTRDYIFDKITNEIFVYWYGTPWNFYGQTQTPRQGKIACGYFVTGVLSDAGFNVPREKWAQLASEIFIRKLTTDIKRFHDKPVEIFKTYVKERGNGIYIVGLDCHVGFVYVKNDIVQFVHANYYHPAIGVMAENLETRNPLNDSRYRVLGKLLDDDMIKKWINYSRYE